MYYKIIVQIPAVSRLYPTTNPNPATILKNPTLVLMSFVLFFSSAALLRADYAKAIEDSFERLSATLNELSMKGETIRKLTLVSSYVPSDDPLYQEIAMGSAPADSTGRSSGGSYSSKPPAPALAAAAPASRLSGTDGPLAPATAPVPPVAESSENPFAGFWREVGSDSSLTHVLLGSTAIPGAPAGFLIVPSRGIEASLILKEDSGTKKIYTESRAGYFYQTSLFDDQLVLKHYTSDGKTIFQIFLARP